MLAEVMLMAGCSRLLFVLMFGILPLTACGSLKPVPAQFNPADYTPIDFELVLQNSPSLPTGQLIRCQAYFWQFLTYDPAPQYYYFNHTALPPKLGRPGMVCLI